MKKARINWSLILTVLGVAVGYMLGQFHAAASRAQQKKDRELIESMTYEEN